MRGAAMNTLLTAAAYNFKKAIKALLNLIKIISEIPVTDDVSLK